MTTTFAATSWPDAAVALGGIALVTVIVAVAIVQIFATGRAGINHASAKEQATRAEELDQRLAEFAASLERVAADTAETRERTAEIERVLKDV